MNFNPRLNTQLWQISRTDSEGTNTYETDCTYRSAYARFNDWWVLKGRNRERARGCAFPATFDQPWKLQRLIKLALKSQQ